MSDPTQRQYVRVGRIIDFEYRADGAAFQARITDLSEGGAFVDTTYPQQEGSELEFRLKLPHHEEVIEGRARVVWQQPMLGMGIQFVDLAPEDRELIRFFVAEVFFHATPEESEGDAG